MSEYRIHTPQTAPEASRRILDQSQKALGFVPNLLGVFAESPAALKGYTTLGQVFESASLDPTERQVVLLSTAFENQCGYCMAAHSTIAGAQGVPAEVVQALRDGTPLADPRLEALRSFTRKVVDERGWVVEQDVDAFLQAGFTQAQVLEVVLGVSLKTLSTYTNHLTELPVDAAFEAHTWARPDQTATV